MGRGDRLHEDQEGWSGNKGDSSPNIVFHGQDKQGTEKIDRERKERGQGDSRRNRERRVYELEYQEAERKGRYLSRL